MAAAFIGLIVLLVGLLIMFNSAFTERGNFGFVVFLCGAGLCFAGFAEAIIMAFF